MKTLLTAIAFVIAIVFTSQAADLPDCPKTTLKNGHYVCGDVDANSSEQKR